MTIVLDEVVRFSRPPDNPIERPRREGVRPLSGTRRQFIKGAVVVGTGAALGLVSSLRLPRVSNAACVSSLNTDTDPICSDANDGFGCDPACGPTVPTSDTCRADTWHKYAGNYRNRPNVCSNNPGEGGADGWFWQKCCAGICGGHLVKFKCHDGCRLVSGVWKNSVCRTLACQGALC